MNSQKTELTMTCILYLLSSNSVGIRHPVRNYPNGSKVGTDSTMATRWEWALLIPCMSSMPTLAATGIDL